MLDAYQYMQHMLQHPTYLFTEEWTEARHDATRPPRTGITHLLSLPEGTYTIITTMEEDEA